MFKGPLTVFVTGDMYSREIMDMFPVLVLNAVCIFRQDVSLGIMINNSLYEVALLNCSDEHGCVSGPQLCH